MTALIISCIALVVSVIAIIVALWKKKEKIELRINDDLTGLRNFSIKTRGVDLEKQKNCTHLFNTFIGHGQSECSKCGLNEDNFIYNNDFNIK